MAANSASYWNFAENVKDELERLSNLAVDAYQDLESNDHPGELGDALSEIKKQLDKISEQLDPAVPLLKKAASALEALPVFKAVK